MLVFKFWVEFFVGFVKLVFDVVELNYEVLLFNEIFINILINNLEFVVILKYKWKIWKIYFLFIN